MILKIMQLIYLHIPYRLHKIAFLEYIELIFLKMNSLSRYSY